MTAEQVGATPTNRPITQLSTGTKAGFGLGALLTVWGTLTLFWPVLIPTADGRPLDCGSAGAAGAAGEQCAPLLGQFRLQALALYACAVIVAVVAFSIFGSRAAGSDAVGSAQG